MKSLKQYIQEDDQYKEFYDVDKKNVSAARNLRIPNFKVIKAWED